MGRKYIGVDRMYRGVDNLIVIYWEWDQSHDGVNGRRCLPFLASAAKSPTSPVSTRAKSFYGRKVAVKNYSDDDPGWTPGTRAKSRGGGKATTGAKRGRKPKEAEVFVISSSEDSAEEVGVKRFRSI